MESKLDAVISSVVLNEPRATGVIIVDGAGLCLSKWGNVPYNLSGTILNIAHRSEYLLPDFVQEDIIPTTIIETNSLKVVVKRHSNWTVGIIIDPVSQPTSIPDLSSETMLQPGHINHSIQ
ncbi:hypothetical protein BB561_000385 [Smittium simulii]|uniref:Uncharacterized protein n=1 Tax=Smittium simulii TaxID=133385 RepID=A0A2T9YZH2_9FUNG|nr:hypothetical protein BB561_000385 [Smittium simulii]